MSAAGGAVELSWSDPCLLLLSSCKQSFSHSMHIFNITLPAAKFLYIVKDGRFIAEHMSYRCLFSNYVDWSCFSTFFSCYIKTWSPAVLSRLCVSFIASWCKTAVRWAFLDDHKLNLTQNFLPVIQKWLWLKLLLLYFPEILLKLHFYKCHVLNPNISSMLLFYVSFSTCGTYIHVCIGNENRMTYYAWCSLNQNMNLQFLFYIVIQYYER